MKKVMIYIVLLLVTLVNANAVLLFEDDFNSGSLNTSYWTQIGSFCSVVSGSLFCTGDTGTGWDHSVTGLGYNVSDYNNISVEYTARVDLDGLNQGMVGLGDNGGASYTNGDLLVYLSTTNTTSGYTNGLTNLIYDHNNLSVEPWYNIRMTTDGTNNYFYYKPNSSSTWYFAGSGSFTTASTLYPFIPYKRGDVYINEFVIYSDGSRNPPSPPKVITFNNVTINNTSSFNNTYYNISPVQLFTNLSVSGTNNNTNVTIYMYNSTSDLILNNQFITNSLSGFYNISFPYEDTFKFFLYAENNETNATTSNYTVHYDITPPSLNVTNNSVWSNYTVDFTRIINVTPGDLCIVTLYNGTGFDCSLTEYNFTYNGNLSFNITANDSAGNLVNFNGYNLFINPTEYFRIFDTVRSIYVQNFTLGSYSAVYDYVSIPLYDLGLGTHTLLFSKLGYAKENKTFTFTNTSALNYTFNATPTSLTLRAFDINTLNQIYFNMSIQNSSNSSYLINQFNYSEFYNNTLNGNLTITINSQGYNLRKLYPFLGPYSSVNLDVYLDSNSSTAIIFRVLEISGTQAIEDAVFNVYTDINATSTFIGQAKTDSTGYTYFYMDTNARDYNIIITKSGYVTQELNTLPGVTSYTILMPEENQALGYLFNGFSYRFSPLNRHINTLPFNASVNIIDESNQLTYYVFTVSSDNYFNQSSGIASNGGTLTFTNINANDSIFNYNLTVIRNGVSYQFLKEYNYYRETEYNTSILNVSEELDSAENNAEKIFIMMFVFIGFMAFGAFFSPIFGAVLGIVPLILFGFVGWLPLGVSILIGTFLILGGLFFRS